MAVTSRADVCIDTDENLDDQGTYYYVPNEKLGTFFRDDITVIHAYRTLTMACYEVLARAIHLDVMKTWTHVSSEASHGRVTNFAPVC